MSTSFAMRNKVQSLDRALEILRLLGAEPEMRVTDLARRLEVHKSTVFRLLATLQEHGLVEQNPTTERYRLGYGLVRLAGSVVGELDLARASRPVLEELAMSTCAAVSVAGPSYRVTPQRLTDLGEMTKDAGEAISRRLGYIPTAGGQE